MIRFFVNNIELVLPEEYSIQHIEENPLITEKGEYTFDIEVSLTEPQNIRALKHLNRLNNTLIEADFDSMMIRNNVPVLGRMVTISNTNTTASLQFLAGNSEVIYLTSDEKKIWEIDFGTEEEIDFGRALNSIVSPNWQNGFICNPVKFNNIIANDYKFPVIVANNSTNPATFFLRHTDGSISPTSLGEEIQIDAVENITMNVYLLFIINRLVEKLGFQLTANILLLDERAKREILINRTNSLKYSDALPDKTIRDFISDIETSFNVVFHFKTDKTAEIIRTDSYIEYKSTYSDAVIIDDYIKEPNTEVYRFDFSKLSYQISSQGIFKYQKLEKSVIEASATESFSTLSNLVNYLSEPQKNNFSLYKITSNEKQFVFTDSPIVNIYRQIVPATSGYVVLVDKFNDFGTGDEKIIELNVLPVEHTQETKKFQFTSQGGDFEYNSGYQLPVINSDLYVGSDQNILEAIEEVKDEIPRADKIEVCLYNGMIYLPILGTVYKIYFKGKYPISFIDDMPEFWITEFDKSNDESGCAADYELWVQDNFKPVAMYTLRINGPAGIYNDYFQNHDSIINTDYSYKFGIIDDPNINMQNKLFYHGNSYLPIKYERTISNKKSTVTGYFYRLQ